MNRRVLYLIVSTATLLGACAPQAPAAPTVDVAGTMAVELAAMMLTQTAAAYSPTPPPTATFTATPPVTETPTLPPAPVATVMPKVMEASGADEAACYLGPVADATRMSSQISSYKDVEFVGVGSVSGWYVIINPYFRTPCWIEAKNLILDPSFDVSAYPTVTK